VSHCQRTLRGEGHSAAGWGIGGSVWLQTAGSKVRSFGQWAATTCAAPLLSLPVSTPLRIVNRCWSGFPCKWRYINVETFDLTEVDQSYSNKPSLFVFFWCMLLSIAGHWLPSLKLFTDICLQRIASLLTCSKFPHSICYSSAVVSFFLWYIFPTFCLPVCLSIAHHGGEHDQAIYVYVVCLLCCITVTAFCVEQFVEVWLLNINHSNW